MAVRGPAGVRRVAPGGGAALTVDVHFNSRAACLLKYRVSGEGQGQAAGPELISALELFTVVWALWSTGCESSGTSVGIFVDHQRGAQPLVY